MDVYVSRDSVAAGDDGDAPHGQVITFADDMSVEEILKGIVDSGYLPSIAGGRAAWSVVSNVPLAVIAQEWPAPRMLPMLNGRLTQLDREAGTLRLHFNYHAQVDPETVYKVFWGFRLKAI